MSRTQIDLTYQVKGVLPEANGGIGSGIPWPGNLDGGTFDPPGSNGTVFNFDGGTF